MGATLFKQVVRSLRYICNNRPDIIFGVGLVSTFMRELKIFHMVTVKRILRYLRGTQDFELLFPKGRERGCVVIEAYSNYDWSGDKLERKNISCYWFKVFDSPISW